MTIRPGLCEKCGRPRSKNGFELGRQRFACRRVECRRRERQRPPEGETAALPWCVRCRRAMIRKCRGRVRCRGCGATCAVDQAPRRLHIPERPDCPACGRHMTRNTKHGKSYFRCQRRACTEARRERREAEIARLAASVAARLPRYLTPDEREDATQDVILDVLAGKAAPEGLTPKVLRGYAARARGLVRDHFRFVSLSQPTEDGREFGDTLAA